MASRRIEVILDGVAPLAQLGGSIPLGSRRVYLPRQPSQPAGKYQADARNGFDAESESPAPRRSFRI